MGWEDQVDRLLDDLEQQAEGLALVERDALVAEQRPGEYAGVDLAARVHASVGVDVRLQVRGVGPLTGRVTRAGDGWLLLTGNGQDAVVRIAALTGARGLSPRAVSGTARAVAARLGLASALRGVAQDRSEVSVHLVDGSTRTGVLGRVGADFVEVAASPGAGARDLEIVPFAALSAVRSGFVG
jgi:hypothetical protein